MLALTQDEDQHDARRAPLNPYPKLAIERTTTAESGSEADRVTRNWGGTFFVWGE